MIYGRGRCQSGNEINGSSQQSVINAPRAGWASKSDAVGVFSITLCNSLCLEASRKVCFRVLVIYGYWKGMVKKQHHGKGSARKLE